MHITSGTPAPELETVDLEGKPFSLASHRGTHVLLTFYRFAGCPFCNLRIREVRARFDALGRSGVQAAAVFHSGPESMRRYLGQEHFPFPLIPDPEEHQYRRWGVQRSWAGMAKTMTRVGPLFRAMRSGHLPGKVEVAAHGMPADFLIGPDGRVLTAHYGSDAYDHLDLDHVLTLVENASAAGD